MVYIDEKGTWEESPLNSNYAKTKYLAEMEVWRGEAEGLNCVVVNPSLILGEADWNKSSTQLMKYVFDEHKFYPQGNLNYVDVQDVAECIFKLTIGNIYFKQATHLNLVNSAKYYKQAEVYCLKSLQKSKELGYWNNNCSSYYRSYYRHFCLY